MNLETSKIFGERVATTAKTTTFLPKITHTPNSVDVFGDMTDSHGSSLIPVFEAFLKVPQTKKA